MTAAAIGLGCLLVGFGWLWANQRALARLITSRARENDLSALGDNVERRWGHFQQTEASVIADRARVDGLEATGVTVLGRLARLEATRPRVEMDAQQRADMQAHWPELVCAECGYCHGGVCPRVRSRKVDAQGDRSGQMVHTSTVVEYWPNGEWQPPPDAVSVLDVWGSPVPTVAEPEPA